MLKGKGKVGSESAPLGPSLYYMYACWNANVSNASNLARDTKTDIDTDTSTDTETDTVTNTFRDADTNVVDLRLLIDALSYE